MNLVISIAIPSIACAFGMLPAALWVFVLGIAGAPGGLIAGYNQQSARFLAGLLICVTGQTFAALTYTALVFDFTNKLLIQDPDLYRLPFWFGAFALSNMPTSIAIKSAIAEKTNSDGSPRPLGAQQAGVPISWVLNGVGMLAFFAFPALIHMGWFWIPGT